MRIQRGNSHVGLLHGNYQPRTMNLARDVMSLPCPSSLHGRHHPAGGSESLPDGAVHEGTRYTAAT